MNIILKRILIIIAAILLAIVSYYFFVGWVNIIPWAVATIVIGYMSLGRKDTIINGALFGYFLFVTYILYGYRGNTDTKSISNIIIFSLLFSLIGAVAGIIGTFIGNLLRKKINIVRSSDKVEKK